MPLGRKLTLLWLTDEQREQLEAWSRSTSMPHGLDLPARIILTSAESLTNTTVAQQLGISLPTVGKWRREFLDIGVQGLHDDSRTDASQIESSLELQEQIPAARMHMSCFREITVSTWNWPRRGDSEPVPRNLRPRISKTRRHGGGA